MPYRKVRVSRAEIVEALGRSYGLISAAARRLGLSPNTLKRRLRSDPTILDEATSDERQDENLEVMQALFERAMAGDVKTLIFLAKLRGVGGSDPRAILPRPLTEQEIQEHKRRIAQLYNLRRR